MVSGDCTTSLATAAGLQQAGLSPGIVWLDAHGDVQTLETTTSGYLGGLPLRLLVGYRPELIAARIGLQPVPERQVLLAGARDLDPADVPGLRYPAPGGPGPAEVASALRHLLGTGRVAAVGIACTWHPGCGAAERTGPYLQAALTTGPGQVSDP